jgi:hypothetical protein
MYNAMSAVNFEFGLQARQTITLRFYRSDRIGLSALLGWCRCVP